MPGIEGRLKTIDGDITTNHRRLENLTLRLADLPNDIPADAIYEQIKAINKKVTSLEAAKSNLSTEQLQLTKGSIDKTELLFRVKRAIANIERASAEDRRPIYSNLIKFAELYPTKIRLGVYAPAASAAVNSNFSAISGSMRAGSCKVIGGPHAPSVHFPLDGAPERT